MLCSTFQGGKGTPDNQKELGELDAVLANISRIIFSFHQKKQLGDQETYNVFARVLNCQRDITNHYWSADILRIKYRIALTLKGLGKHFEALEFFRDVFQGKDTRALDPLYWYDPKFNNGEILDACENFILTLENVGLRSEAETQRYAIIDFFERNQGPGDLFTLGTLYDLTMYKSDKGGTNSYIENLERIVRGYELILGRDHEATIGAAKRLGKAYRSPPILTTSDGGSGKYTDLCARIPSARHDSWLRKGWNYAVRMMVRKSEEDARVVVEAATGGKKA